MEDLKDVDGNIVIKIPVVNPREDYKAPHALRGTPARRHKPRKLVNALRRWAHSNRGGTFSKRLFA